MPDAPDDTALLLAAGRGDRRAFGELVQRHHRAVVHFAARFLGLNDRDAAEDIAQDVFLAAWQSAPSFKPRAAVLTWLLRIATNRCLNHKRARRRRPTVPLDAEPAAPGEDAPDEDLSRRLVAAMAELPPRQRAAVLLRHAHGLGHEDIAAALETSAPVVKQLLFRAHRKLRDLAVTPPRQRC
jgi:RNA polymerase sigma-70 factor (ECF subfamily)